MLRFSTMTLAALAIATLPLAAVAENPTPPSSSEIVVVAAVEDALPTAPARPLEAKARAVEPNRGAHGSSQSMASFRFSNPHGYPLQTLPVNFPSFPTFGF